MPNNYRRTSYSQSQGQNPTNYRRTQSVQQQENEPQQQMQQTRQAYQRRGSSYARQASQQAPQQQSRQQNTYRGRGQTQNNAAVAPVAQMPQQRRTANRYQAVPVGNRYDNGRYGQQNQRRSAYAPAAQQSYQQSQQRQAQWDRPTGRYGLDYEEEYQAPQRYQDMYEEEEAPMQQDQMMRGVPDEYEPQDESESKVLSIAVGALGGALVVGIIFVLLYLHETGVF